MLYYLLDLLYRPDSPLSFVRVFRYLSFRMITSAITAFLLSLVLGPAVIRRLKRRGLRDVARDFGLTDVAHKSGTPTMGGLLIVAALLLPSLLWCDLSNRFIQLVLAATIWFAVLGSLDDFLKLTRGKSGLSEGQKYVGQAVFGAVLAAAYLWPKLSPVPPEVALGLYLPFLKTPFALHLVLQFVFIMFVVIAITNSVNLTDGLDGLAIVPATLVAAIYGAFGYVMGNARLAAYLNYEFLPGAGELAVFCAATVGAGIGFLWYNCYPAQLFMGDTGALALGGIFATLAVLIKQEFLFLIAGGVFVVEAGSVLIQKYVYIRFVGRRLFLRTPLHHSFQHRGLAEPKVVIRFWIAAFIGGLLALATMKLR